MERPNSDTVDIHLNVVFKQVAYSGLNLQSTTGVYITANEKNARHGDGRRDWNRGGVQETLAREGALIGPPKVPSYTTADMAGLPTQPGPFPH